MRRKLAYSQIEVNEWLERELEAGLPETWEPNQIQVRILEALRLGPASLEQLYRATNIDQRRDVNRLTISKSMLNSFLPVLVPLLRANLVTYDGDDPLVAKWRLNTK